MSMDSNAANDMAEARHRIDVVTEIVAALREEAHALREARQEADREGHGWPSSPISVGGAFAVANWIESHFGERP